MARRDDRHRLQHRAPRLPERCADRDRARSFTGSASGAPGWRRALWHGLYYRSGERSHATHHVRAGAAFVRPFRRRAGEHHHGAGATRLVRRQRLVLRRCHGSRDAGTLRRHGTLRGLRAGRRTAHGAHHYLRLQGPRSARAHRGTDPGLDPRHRPRARRAQIRHRHGPAARSAGTDGLRACAHFARRFEHDDRRDDAGSHALHPLRRPGGDRHAAVFSCWPHRS